MLRFLKNWTLPVAMLTGAIGYSFFIHFSFLTAYLIFAMLLLTFCKVSPRELRIKPLHAWLLLIQVVGALAVYLALYRFNKVVAEGVMICVLCPTAAAAAVTTTKLGGSAASLTTYTLLSNLAVAIVVPLFFPLVEPQPGLRFWGAFLLILGKVFPLLIFPFLTAWGLKRWVPSVHRQLLRVADMAFYLWAVSIVIVTALTVHSIANDPGNGLVETVVALGALVACLLQFVLGKRIGDAYRDGVSGRQALGQKNTILAIWMAHTYLNPLSAVGPGAYVLWQNLIISWLLWKRRRAV
ncbi:MAG: transporter [Mediterranea sp.]|nr:transporter [Mediterranea sp.]